MFLIYINDLRFVKLNSCIMLYADDMIIYTSKENWTDVQCELTDDIKQIYNWTLYNRLTINFTKSKCRTI